MRESERAPVVISLLGGFAVWIGERTALNESWSRRKAKALLKRLAVQEGHALHRERLMDELWPDLDAEAAANNLYKNLHYLRAALREALLGEPIVRAAGERIALAESVRVDVDAFRASAAHARASQGDLGLYEQALGLYTGDLLPDDPYEDWAAQPREELRLLHIQLLLEASARSEARGQIEPALERLQQVVRADPALEEAHRALMRLYAQTGRRQRALRQYEVCRAALERSVGMEPGAETEALRQQIVEGSVPELVGTGPVDWMRAASWAPVALFGREQALASLDLVCGKALGGQGGAVLITGPAGIGKSSLAEGIARRAADESALVLTGRSFEMEAPIALQPVRELLEEALARVRDERVQQVARRSLYLGRLLPHAEAPETLGVPAADPATLQVELFTEVGELVRAIAAITPVVLRFEDLHAADEASLRLFHFLCRQVEGKRALVLATLRTEDGPSAPLVAGLLGSLRREQLAVELSLAPLDEHAIQQLIAQRFPEHPAAPAVVDLVCESAEGNPFFAVELTRTLIEEGQVAVEDGRWQLKQAGTTPVPGPVLDLVTRRTQRLSEQARRVLRLAAVLGRTFAYPALRHMAGMPETDALDTLDECIGAGIVHETETGYQFRHGLFREAVYRSLTRARREQAHRAAASALEALRGQVEADVEAIGYHYAASDVPWHAVPYLAAAARRAAAVFAGQQALALYEQAAALARRHPAFVERVSLAALLEEAGGLLTRMGETTHALALHQGALAIFSEVGDGDGIVRTRAKVALGDVVAGNVTEATELLQRTIQEVSAQKPPVGIAWVYYVLAQLRWHTSRNREALEAAEQAVAAAEASGEVEQRARAYEVLALACHSLGDWQRGIEYEVKRQMLAASGYDVDLALDSHLCLWEYHLSGDQPYTEVERMVRQALARATAVGNRRAMSVCYHALGTVQYVQGELTASEESLRRGVELARSAGSLYSEIIGSQRLGVVETELGRPEEAYERLRGALRMVEVSGNPYIQAHGMARVLAALTENRVQADDLPGARAYLAQALAAQAHFGECVSCDTLLYPAAVPVQLAAGELDTAEEMCRRAEMSAAAFRSQARLVTARYLRGLVAAARGDWAAARGHLEAALATFTRLGQPLDAARCREALAELALRSAAAGVPAGD